MKTLKAKYKGKANARKEREKKRHPGNHLTQQTDVGSKTATAVPRVRENMVVPKEKRDILRQQGGEGGPMAARYHTLPTAPEGVPAQGAA